MEDFWNALLGLDHKDLVWYQMACRAVMVFFTCLVFIRIAGMRTFGKKSPFDIIVGITLGAVLSRSITGEVPFFPSLGSGLVLVVLHRVLAVIVSRSKTVETWVKGEKAQVVKEGQLLTRALHANALTERDVLESVRFETHLASLEDVDEAHYETSGKTSVIPKKKHNQEKNWLTNGKHSN